MASNILPQALFMIPRNPTQCHPKTLGFSAFLSRRPSSLCSISRVSISAFGSSRSFVVRAESNSEGEAEATAENVEDNEEAVDSEAPEIEAETEAEVEYEIKAEVEEEAKPPRKPRIKLGDIMGVEFTSILFSCKKIGGMKIKMASCSVTILNKRAIEASEKERPVPDLRTGDIVEIKLEVPENRRRLSIYKGIVISKQNAGIHTTIRIRRIIAGIGVEIVFPVYSPNIKEIRVLSHRKVRRARLYYLRDKLPRLSTFK